MFFLSQSSWGSLLKTLKLAVWALSLSCLHVFTLLVIDIHQNRFISLFLTPFIGLEILTCSGMLSARQLTICLLTSAFVPYEFAKWKLLQKSKKKAFNVYCIIHFLLLWSQERASSFSQVYGISHLPGLRRQQEEDHPHLCFGAVFFGKGSFCNWISKLTDHVLLFHSAQQSCRVIQSNKEKLT